MDSERDTLGALFAEIAARGWTVWYIRQCSEWEVSLRRPDLLVIHGRGTGADLATALREAIDDEGPLKLKGSPAPIDLLRELGLVKQVQIVRRF